MNFQSFFWLFILFFISSIPPYCQSELALGQWRSHIAFKEGRRITQSPEKIIFASSRGIISIDKEDLSVDFLSKEDGFSDALVSDVYFDQANDQLILLYANQNIDVLKGLDIFNIPFINTNASIIGSKDINQLYIQDENRAYIATDFGVLGFDLKSLTFPFTTFTQLKINTLAVWNNQLFAGSDEGLFTIPLEGSNLSDFSSWQSLGENQGLPQWSDVSHLSVKYNSLYASINNELYRTTSDNGFTSLFQPNLNESIAFISSEGNFLMVGVRNGDNTKILYFKEDNTFEDGGYGCGNRVNNALEDEKGRIWLSDDWDPIKFQENRNSGTCQRLSFSVPFTNTFSQVRFKRDKAYVATGGVTEDFGYAWTRSGFSTLEGNNWENFNPNRVQDFRPENEGGKDFANLFTLVPHPTENKVYLGSYLSGMMLYDEDSESVVNHWDKNNSILQGAVGDSDRTRISGLAFDKEGNLWISNYLSPQPLVVKTKEDTWHSFNVPGNTQLHQIAIDNQGNKWIPVYGSGNGIIVFNENGNVADPTNNKIRYITRSNSEITGNRVNCVMVDLEGGVWVGTDEGPVVFECGDPFVNACNGNRRRVIVDDIPAPLLRYEDILTMAVDGANRKWFGTRNGIFVQSPDGINEIARFEVNNSPLLNNRVTHLSFNGQTGEMFIITPDGLQSFKTPTTEGRRVHSSNVYAYPNPVRPDYQGDIAIKGLVRDANVKITDISGKLIFETTALGGQAIWNGRDYNGNKAATGVYLVFSANDNISFGTESLVTKILIVN